ncbi:hypothetical protein BJF92_08870 [Rhizobium rhizosphaerae]|uniref:Uncharacterized protein n=2 Tax=Xaviernesmea rhizosphaerae TaxID=1672749 RepID=A0A1Q9AHC4_9HYPH|nr:hypothetical protein BJF92_08870 [Xaviernesmea rhizosphaerae]
MKAGESAKSGRRILVRLDGLNECSAVFGAVAAAVGLPNTGGQPYVDAIVQWLRETRLCLVLDNCEHVADPVVILVRALLSGTQGVRVVATSRTPLGIAGERHLRLLPLNEAEAQDLFLARCQERVHGFEQDDAALKAIKAICQAVDGLPLAIELATGWIGALPIQDIAIHIAQGLDLLQRPRAQTARHATLTDTIAWSYTLLSPPARLLLQQLAVFPGSFGMEAVSGICMAREQTREDLWLALRELVEHSLVQFDLPSGRYRLLNTVRLFAIRLAQDAGAFNATREAHAKFFAALGMQARGVDFVPEDQWLPRLQVEIDNFQVALRTMLDARRGIEALALAAALTTFWWTASRHREGIGWILAASGQAQDAPPILQAAAQFSLGFLGAHDTGDWAMAAIELDRGLNLLASSDDAEAERLRGYLLCLRGECDIMAGAPEAGLESALEGAKLIARFAQDQWGQGFAAWNVAFGYERAGDWRQAVTHYERVVASQREGSLVVRMIGCQSLASALESQGSPAEAVPLFDEALHLCRQVGLTRLGDVHGSLARLLADCAHVRVAADIDLANARPLALEAQAAAEALQDMAAAAMAAAVLERLSAPSPVNGIFKRQGSIWVVGLQDNTVMLPESRGLRQLWHLLQQPGQEISAGELAVAADGQCREVISGDAVLDPKAVAQYRKRLRLLDQALALDSETLDDERRAAVRREHAFVSQELARSTGLDGRVRRTSSFAERMRVNVTRTLRAAIAEIETAHPALGQHLADSVRTGNFCSYQPSARMCWQF